MRQENTTEFKLVSPNGSHEYRYNGSMFSMAMTLKLLEQVITMVIPWRSYTMFFRSCAHLRPIILSRHS